MLDRAKKPYLPITWLIEQLGQRSFGLTFFVMGVVALIPGASGSTAPTSSEAGRPLDEISHVGCGM
jgi:hypothetical protein